MKRILFLSSVDFKEKSIQVIRKTPEAYRDAGWEVHYVVGRDQSKAGDYFYENVVNPEGIHIYRFTIPFARLHGSVSNKVWQALWFRIRTFIFVMQLSRRAMILSRKFDFDIVYGYEISGVLAARFVRSLGILRKQPLVTRFQGVLFVKEWLKRNQWFRKITNLEAVLALRTKADLVVMTNDGSQGVDVLRKLNSPNKHILFVSNGVDIPVLDPGKLEEIRKVYYPSDCVNFISVSRLDAHKRIDRGIKIIDHLVHTLKMTNVRYSVIGGGMEWTNLKRLVVDMGLDDYVFLLGPISHTEVPYHITCAQWLISMYTSSNVGNPLLESIRLGKPVVTLNNGDTGEWVRHRETGLIYDVDDRLDLQGDDYLRIANDIRACMVTQSCYEGLAKNTKEFAGQKLWTWKERFDCEIGEVSKLIVKK